MNTTALGSGIARPQHAPVTAGLVEALRVTARDFVCGLLSVTKASLLERQPTRPRLRRF